MAKQGHSNAFSKIVEKYQRPVYNLCYHMLDDATNAEDATQEVFIRAYFKLHTYDESRQFSTWLFAIASHYCLDRLKMRRVGLVSWDDLSSRHTISSQGANQPERAFIKAELMAEVRHLLQTLYPEYRTAIILKYWYDMSYEEIAETMETTTSAIKSRLFRARKMMAIRAAVAVSGTTAQITAPRYQDGIVSSKVTLATGYGS